MRSVLLVIILIAFMSRVEAAKTVHSAVLGKLVPAVLKCLGTKVVGVDMNKVYHIVTRVHHGLDKLDPSEIVYETVKLVAT